MHRAQRLPGDYTGAMVAGGRWNPIGTPMLYAAEHLSLACLEVLVHLEKGQLPRDYVWSKTELRDTPELLTRNILPSAGECQAAGGAWITGGNQLAILVPSVVVREEFNVLINPNHTAFTFLVWNEPRPFHFDPRLFAAEPQIL
jgi:RES domain-containing protein